MRRILVNDCMGTIGNHTLWHDLKEWFDMEFIGGDFLKLSQEADEKMPYDTSLIVRNGSWFGPMASSEKIPTISIIQDILDEKQQQKQVAKTSAVVCNSEFTQEQYRQYFDSICIPLPIDPDIFELGNEMGLQQAIGIPPGSICWVGACMGNAGKIKGFDLFMRIVRQNPDLCFIAVFKDKYPDTCPPNMRMFCRMQQKDLAKLMAACRMGFCTSLRESQHLAGIEMGYCGLPLVVPDTGIYWKRSFPGHTVERSVELFTDAIRNIMDMDGVPNREAIRDYWVQDFHPSKIRSRWNDLVESVERHPCSGVS